MTERPILFSGPMVRALLAGTKTQTRRTVKPQPDWLPEVGSTLRTDGFFWPIGSLGQQCGAPLLKCPYGVPGDVLWVRETCRAEELSRPQQTRAATRLERERLGRTSVIELDELDGVDGVRYLADNAWVKIENTRAAGEAWSDLYHYDSKRRPKGSAVPSIHMPRWASRISLKITDVRVERLQDISEADALAEGMTFPEGMAWGNDPIDAYAGLWNQINGPGSWDANPWVWAVSFERLP